MNVVYLSRRNLLTLLNKLDRVQRGENSACAIIKHDNVHPKYPTDCALVLIAAVEDDAYYTKRNPGQVLPIDEPDSLYK